MVVERTVPRRSTLEQQAGYSIQKQDKSRFWEVRVTEFLTRPKIPRERTDAPKARSLRAHLVLKNIASSRYLGVLRRRLPLDSRKYMRFVSVVTGRALLTAVPREVSNEQEVFARRRGHPEHHV
jgi:hypothetical protein